MNESVNTVEKVSAGQNVRWDQWMDCLSHADRDLIAKKTGFVTDDGYDMSKAAAFEMACIEERGRKLRNKRARENRKARKSAYRSCGMTKVRGAQGGTYWE